MDRGGGNGRLALRGADLIEPAHKVPRGVEPWDRCLLVVIDIKSAPVIETGAEPHGEVDARLDAKRGINQVEMTRLAWPQAERANSLVIEDHPLDGGLDDVDSGLGQGSTIRRRQGGRLTPMDESDLIAVGLQEQRFTGAQIRGADHRQLLVYGLIAVADRADANQAVADRGLDARQGRFVVGDASREQDGAGDQRLSARQDSEAVVVGKDVLDGGLADGAAVSLGLGLHARQQLKPADPIGKTWMVMAGGYPGRATVAHVEDHEVSPEPAEIYRGRQPRRAGADHYGVKDHPLPTRTRGFRLRY